MLTKSKYIQGLQCPRLMWASNKKLLPEITIADEVKFSHGYIFEDYAKSLFKGTQPSQKFKDNIEETQELIKQHKTIFEGAFVKDDLYARVDILEYNNGWNLYEVKSSNDVKDVHLHDLAFQKHVLNVPINKFYVIHLNKEFVKNGPIDPKQLCQIDDVTEQVNAINVEDNIIKFRQILEQKTIPEIIISKGCNGPYECPLKKDCWGTLPKYNVLQLKNHHVYWKLFQKGIVKIEDVQEELKEKDEIIKQAVVTQKAYLDKEKVKQFLDTLKYPLYHFDFETFMTAVPIYDNSKPWQQIPFQYSLHIEKKEGSLEHKEFLADGKEDPRIKLLKQLKDDLKGEGSIIVYNKSFEITRLKEMARDFPKHQEWIEQVLPRIVDLAEPFKNFHYYHPEQQGKYSIKVVLPILTDLSYKDLEINEGGTASAEYYLNYIANNYGNEELRNNLLKYCCLDTKAMIDLTKKLFTLVER